MKCVYLILDFSKNILYDVSVIRFALQKTVHVDTRFSTDTDKFMVVNMLRKKIAIVCKVCAVSLPSETGVESTSGNKTRCWKSSRGSLILLVTCLT